MDPDVLFLPSSKYQSDKAEQLKYFTSAGESHSFSFIHFRNFRDIITIPKRTPRPRPETNCTLENIATKLADKENRYASLIITKSAAIQYHHSLPCSCARRVTGFEVRIPTTNAARWLTVCSTVALPHGKKNNRKTYRT